MKKNYIEPWKDYAERYKKLYWAPGKPTEEDIEIFSRFIKEVFKRNKLKKAKVLVLGVTPSLRDEIAKFNAKVTCVDINEVMINEMNKLITHTKKEKIIKANWLNMPLKRDYFDIIISDLALGNIDEKNKKSFFIELRRVLKQNSYWIVRVWYIPSDWKIQSTEEILKKFSKMKQDYNRSTELFCNLLFNTLNQKRHEFHSSKVKNALAKYWKDGRYVYPDKVVEKLMNQLYQKWKPFEKVWHTGTKKEVFSWISEYFDIIEEDYAKNHLFGYCFPILFCKVKN